MEQPSLLDWKQAESRRDDGMQRAVEHADDVKPYWSDMAMTWVLVYRDMHAEFLAEDVRAYAHAGGLPGPPDGRAWGAVIRRAAKAGHIVKVGYAPAKTSNLSPKVLWGRPA